MSLPIERLGTEALNHCANIPQSKLKRFTSLANRVLAGLGVFRGVYAENIMLRHQLIDHVLDVARNKKEGNGILVAIDGAIASGKTTLSDHLFEGLKNIPSLNVAQLDRDDDEFGGFVSAFTKQYARVAVSRRDAQDVLLISGGETLRHLAKDYDVGIMVYRNSFQRLVGGAKRAIDLYRQECFDSSRGRGLKLLRILHLTTAVFFSLISFLTGAPFDPFQFVWTPIDRKKPFIILKD